MKSRTYFTGTILSALLLSGMPLQAFHLDGLWRNDRQNITLRIESFEDGFRAKRIDQGIWYKYVAEDEYHFIDRYGNFYTLQDEDEIVWTEATSGKRISFTKVSYRDEYRWPYRDDRYDRDHPFDPGDEYDRYDDHGYQPWMDQWYDDHRGHIDGRWIDHYRKDEIEIECFRGGIRVKRHHGGWEKYYLDRYGNCYKDRYGNSIHLIDRDSIQWKSDRGRENRIYHRHR